MKPTAEIMDVAQRTAVIVQRQLGSNVRVVLFGSWADGSAHERSDIDIGILAGGPTDGATMEKIREAVDRSPTLYTVDLVDLARVPHSFRELALKTAEELP